MGKTMRRVFLDGGRGFKPGDPRPEGYIAWMSWADAQHKAGLCQNRCTRCHLYYFPQELAVDATAEAGPICLACAIKVG